MSFSCKVEEITPAIAHQYLALSIGNRPLNADFVLSCAVTMEAGKWNELASEVVFDEDGTLIDGHHRLHAIIAYGQSVRMLVKRGVAREARGLIDTGRTRSIRDLFTMFRSDVTYVDQRKAALTTCVTLLLPGRPPQLRTFDSFDSWMRQFKEGIDAIIELTSEGGAGTRHMRLGPVSGAFAFAHKLNPSKVSAFAMKVRDGLGLTANEPARTLRALLLSGGRHMRGGRGADRIVLAKKVLQAIHAELKNRPYAKAQVGNEGLEFFRAAYDTRTIDKLVSLWTPEGAVVSES